MTDVFPPDDDSELVVVRKIVPASGGSATVDAQPQTSSEPATDDDKAAAETPTPSQEEAASEHADGSTETADSELTGAKRADKRTADKPTADKPTADKPAADKPAADKPAGAGEPVEAKLVKVVSISHDEDLDGPMPVPIDDDDGSLVGDSRPTVSTDPRLRERRQEVDRLITRKRLIVGLGIFTVLLLVVGTLAVFASTIFDVKTITVYGNVFTTDDQLAPILAELRGKPILTVDINKARTQIEALPFVKQADIATDFPHTVHIEIEERQPALSYIGTDGQWRIIDDDGRVLTILGGQPADYKPVNGVGPAIDPGGYAGAGYGAAATIARSLPSELQPYMASFNVKSTGDIDLVLSTDTVISFGQPTDMTAKLAAVLTRFRTTPPSKVAAIDVTNPAALGVTLK